MRRNLFLGRGSRPTSRRQRFRRAFRPLLELLESRLVPAGFMGITSISPNMAQEGSPDLLMTVNGANFVPGAVVEWNGMDLATTFVSASQLKATVPASLLAEETTDDPPMHGGPILITVVEGGVESNAQTFSVTEAPITPMGGFTFMGPALMNVTLATFNDAGGPELPFPSDYTASVDWGDGSLADAGIISGPDINGVFSVTGSHAYASTDPTKITVTIVHEAAPPVTVMDFVNENEGPVSATGGFVINGVEGQPFLVTVATFTNPNDPDDTASAFSATISWGDASSSAGAVFGPDINGVFTVKGSHTYKEESTPDHGGPYTISVTILNEFAAAATVTDTANIAEAPVSATGGFTFTGPTLNNVTVATFKDTGGPEKLSDYSAAINWGDATSSPGTISGPDASGVFTITGSHTYTGNGPFTISVMITHETALTVTVTNTVNVPPTISATGGFTIFGVEGPSQAPNNATVATFTSSNPNAKASDFTATIQWGDAGFQPVNDITSGTISGPQNGVFTVKGSYTYNEESEDAPGSHFIITVTIKQGTAASAVALSQAIIFDAALNPTGGFNIPGKAGQSTGNVTVATFIDTGGPFEGPLQNGIYVPVVNWGDGSTPDQGPGLVSGPDLNGVFTITGNHTYTAAGTFTITVTIAHEFATTVSVTDTATMTSMAPPPGGASNGPGKESTMPADTLLPGTDMLVQTQGPGAEWAAFMATSSRAAMSGQPSQSDDAYWQILSQPDRVTDPSHWAADELALALGATWETL